MKKFSMLSIAAGLLTSCGMNNTSQTKDHVVVNDIDQVYVVFYESVEPSMLALAKCQNWELLSLKNLYESHPSPTAEQREYIRNVASQSPCRHKISNSESVLANDYLTRVFKDLNISEIDVRPLILANGKLSDEYKALQEVFVNVGSQKQLDELIQVEFVKLATASGAINTKLYQYHTTKQLLEMAINDGASQSQISLLQKNVDRLQAELEIDKKAYALDEEKFNSIPRYFNVGKRRMADLGKEMLDNIVKINEINALNDPTEAQREKIRQNLYKFNFGFTPLELDQSKVIFSELFKVTL